MSSGSRALLGAVACACALLLSPLACDVGERCGGAYEERDGWCYLRPAASGGAAGAAGQAAEAGERSTSGAGAGGVEAGAGGAAAGSSAAGASAAGAGGLAPGDSFGKPCTDTVNWTDCGGDAPICPEQLHYCTNVYCQPGEQNAGICPEGWMCYVSAPNPSACVNLGG